MGFGGGRCFEELQEDVLDLDFIGNYAESIIVVG